MTKECKAEKHLGKAMAALVAAGIGAEWHESLRGVPMLLIHGPDGEPVASVAWFGRSRAFRMFYPWPSEGEGQARFTTSIMRDLVARAGTIAPRVHPNGWATLGWTEDDASRPFDAARWRKRLEQLVTTCHDGLEACSDVGNAGRDFWKSVGEKAGSMLAYLDERGRLTPAQMKAIRNMARGADRLSRFNTVVEFLDEDDVVGD